MVPVRPIRESDIVHKTRKEADSHDPIAKSWREADNFNAAWLRNGERLTWIQRTGFSVVSLITFGSGILLLTFALNSLINGTLQSLFDLVETILGVLVSLSITVLGVLGLRNVLRFESGQEKYGDSSRRRSE